MLTSAFSRRSQGEQIILGHALKRNDVAYLEFAVGKGAGLIKGDGIDFSHLLESFAGFDDNTVFCGLADRRHDSGRCCKHKSAGTEHDHYRDRSDDILCYSVGNDGDQQGNRNQPACPPVRNALCRSLILFRVFHHSDQFLERTVFTDFGSFNINGTEAVDCTAEYGVPYGFIDRQALTCHNRLIDRCFPDKDHAVNRNSLPGKDTKHIFLPDLGYRNLRFDAVSDDSSCIGRKRDQVLQSLLRPVRSHIFEESSDLHNEGNLTCGEEISDTEGCDHRHRDQKSGRYLTDTPVVYDPPNGKIEERDAADHNADPCQILSPRLTGPRKDERRQQEYTPDDRHHPPCKKVIDLFDHKTPPIDSASAIAHNLYDTEHNVHL